MKVIKRKHLKTGWGPRLESDILEKRWVENNRDPDDIVYAVPLYLY